MGGRHAAREALAREAPRARLLERRVADVADRVDAVDARHHFVVDGDAAVVLVVDLLLDEVCANCMHSDAASQGGGRWQVAGLWRQGLPVIGFDPAT